MSAVKFATLFLVCSAVALAMACGSSFEGKIVFVSDRDGASEILLVDHEKAEVSRLTGNAGQTGGARWSPDGERVIYVSDESGASQVYQVDLKGKTVAQVTNSANVGNSPVWSPDGRRFLFTSSQQGNTEVFWAALDGRQATRITKNDLDERLGDWSANGQWVVFYVEGPADKRGLWLRNPDGVNLVHLTRGTDADPVWSPDGRRIAFVRDREGNLDIHVVKRPNDGTWLDPVEEFRLTQDGSEDSSPAWSPDGKALAFVSYRDGNAEIYAMRADGDAKVRLTINRADDTDPVWSPNGKSIAFVSYLYGHSEIFSMDSDGSRQRRLTNNQVLDLAPDW